MQTLELNTRAHAEALDITRQVGQVAAPPG